MMISKVKDVEVDLIRVFWEVNEDAEKVNNHHEEEIILPGDDLLHTDEKDE